MNESAKLLDEYCKAVMLYLATDELNAYQSKLCAYYFQLKIPEIIAAQNIRRAMITATTE